MKNMLTTFLLVCVLFNVTSANSSELKRVQDKQSEQSPEKLIEGGMKMIIDALNLILKTAPQYEAPKIMKNGDIIIRRSKPKPDLKNKLPNQNKI